MGKQEFIYSDRNGTGGTNHYSEGVVSESGFVSLRSWGKEGDRDVGASWPPTPYFPMAEFWHQTVVGWCVSTHHVKLVTK